MKVETKYNIEDDVFFKHEYHSNNWFSGKVKSIEILIKKDKYPEVSYAVEFKECETDSSHQVREHDLMNKAEARDTFLLEKNKQYNDLFGESLFGLGDK